MIQNKKSTYLALFGVILAVGLMASAFILGHQFKNFRQSGVITVKGLAEAEHKATLGSWKLSISALGQTYSDALEKNQKSLNTALQFLLQQGFPQDEREITDVSVVAYMEEYYDHQGNRREMQNGYIARRDVVLSTKNLDLLQKAVTEIQSLRAENEDIHFYSPQYYLENLEAIKRDLIAKATQDAYVRAEEFAKTSRAKVGALRSASQGSFDIKSARPDSADSSYYGGSYDTSTINKKVRLVVTIEYQID